MVEKLIKQLQDKGLLAGDTRQPMANSAKCWCCGDSGHMIMQCPTIIANRSAQKGAGRSKVSGKQVRGQIGAFRGPGSDQIVERIKVAGIDVCALVDTGATTHCCSRR